MGTPSRWVSGVPSLMKISKLRMKSFWKGKFGAGNSGAALRGKKRKRLTPKRAPKSRSMISPNTWALLAPALKRRSSPLWPSSSMSLASSPRTLRLLGDVIEPPRVSVLAPRAMLSVVSARWGKIQLAKSGGAKSITPPGALVFSTLWAPRITLAWIAPPPLRQPSPLAPTTMVSAATGRPLKTAMSTARRREYRMGVCYAFPPDLSRIRRTSRKGNCPKVADEYS